MSSLPGITIRAKIYESSSSLVYRGVREQDGLPIILKVLKHDYPTPAELIRYRQEYEVTRSLNLEGVVKVYSQQDYQRTLVMMLEDFGGESLEKWMQDSPQMYCPIPLPVFLCFAVKIAEILGRIHFANVIHKDINPSNIVFNPGTGQVKIIDFGIATRFTRTNPSFKSPHVLEGTLAYMSPEQTGRMNRAMDYRTDFYSLGVTFYELLCGRLPFEATDAVELVHCHIAKQPIPPHELNSEVPKAVSNLVLKLLAKNAENRYQSAWGIKVDLQECLNQLKADGRIEAFSLARHDVSDKFQISQKLYGREQEITTLLTAFERVSQGKSEMMLVSGYSGIGKSALVQEIYKPITRQRGYFASGKFDQLQGNIPYSSLIQAFQELIQQLLTESEIQIASWREKFLAALGNNGQIIVDVIPEIGLIIGKQPAVVDLPSTESQNRFNLAFQNFIKVFTQPEHPLVIFLDDLQWVDNASLKLIQLLMTAPNSQYLLLIGAYRDNEVSAAHSLMLTLDEIKKAGVIINYISLSPLDLTDTNQLIADTLNCEVKNVTTLADLVSQKTGGNPFFLNEFLKSLYQEKLLNFELNLGRWQWSLEQIQAAQLTDNVVELIADKIQKLSEPIQQILKLAASIGNQFNYKTLLIISEKSQAETTADLWEAVQEGLILPIGDDYKYLQIKNSEFKTQNPSDSWSLTLDSCSYKFLHDRVQQAVYSLISEADKKQVHLQIGQLLLKSTPPESLEDKIFDIVNQLNIGVELITDQTQKDELAQLNFIAGKKAKTSTAYKTALSYFHVGQNLLSEICWTLDYDFTFALTTGLAECEFLCGRFDEADYYFDLLLEKAQSRLDKGKIYDLKIHQYENLTHFADAIRVGYEALALFGVYFPDLLEEKQAALEVDLSTIQSLVGNRTIDSLIDLPVMEDPEDQMVMKLLSNLHTSFYLVGDKILTLLNTSKMVCLSLTRGNAPESAHAYVLHAMHIGSIRGDYKSSYEFGLLAMHLNERLPNPGLRAKILMNFSWAISIWRKPIVDSFAYSREAIRLGSETGHFSDAAYAFFNDSYFTLLAGRRELGTVQQVCEAAVSFTKRIKMHGFVDAPQVFRQWSLALQGLTESPTSLTIHKARTEPTASFDEDVYQLTHRGHSLFEMFYLIAKLALLYTFDRYLAACEVAQEAERVIRDYTGTIWDELRVFYHALAIAALYDSFTAEEQQKAWNQLTDLHGKMRIWAKNCPENFLHQYLLISAEMARISGNHIEAMEFYERGIQSAVENEFMQNEALANELYAKFWLHRKNEKITRLYINEAHYSYVKWGATAKVKDLETRYPQFFPPSSSVDSTAIRTASETISTRLDSAFDLAAVLKASQAISSEIELDRLLGSLMQILIENAGAQTGFLILENSGDWVIEAACELDEGEQVCATRVLQSIPIATRLPASIIQYVIRTHESVILNDATHEGNFINESYIQHNQTQSVFCLPLLNQSKLVGVLYLENQLATGAFTPERSQVLHLLSTQAAIAIENAKLYSRLRASESRMTQFLEAIPVGIAVVDVTSRPYYFNQRAIQLVGKGTDPSVTLEQLAEAYQLYRAGTNQQYPTEELPTIRALSGERTTVDDLEIHQNSAIIPVEVWGTPIFDEQGNVAYALTAFQDITERRQAEQLLADYNRTLEQQVAERTAALQRSEAKFRNIFENSQVCIFRTRLSDGLILDANQRLVELFGFDSPDEIIGIKRTTDFYVNPVVLHPHLGELQIFDKNVRNIEVQIRKRNGALLWGLYSFCLNTADGYMECVISDISDRKQAEAALQNSEERLRLALTATNQGLYDLDLKTEERIFNPEYALMLGYDPATFHEPISEWIARLHPDDRESVVATYRAYIAGEIPSYQAEYRQRTQDGRWKWTLSVGKIVAWDESGQPMRMLGTHADIDDRKRAEEASILEERNHMAREIHDTLAQAFTGIIIHTRSASDEVTADPEKAQTLLTQILDLARSGLAEARRSVEALHRPHLLESSNLQDALSRLAAQLDSSIATQIVYEVIGTPYPLSSDLENNLFRIGQEALTNAIKYAEAHEIRIELVYEPTQCSLRIKDNGQGFDVENQAMRNGFGLLGIVQRAERIRAELKIQSHLGQGTEITVSINRE